MRFTLCQFGLVTLSLAAAACSGGEDSPPPGTPSAELGTPTVTEPDGDSPIVTQVDFDDGRSFRFIEAAPGNIMMDESGPVGVLPTARRVNLADLEPMEVFARIAPDAIAPAKLVDASARYDALQEQVLEEGVPERESLDTVVDGQHSELAEALEGELVEKAIDDSLCPASWFQYALCIPGSAHWKVCSTYRTGVNEFTRVDTGFGESVVCTYRGQTQYRVRIRPWFSWETVLNVSVPAGRYHWSNKSKLIDFDYEFRGDAGTGGYHISGYGYRRGANRGYSDPPYQH